MSEISDTRHISEITRRYVSEITRRCVGIGYGAHQQTFDGPADRDATAKEAGGKDTRVVDDEEIARAEQLRERTDVRVTNAAGAAIQLQQSRRRPVSGGLLGDQLGWQVEIEIADEHPR